MSFAVDIPELSTERLLLRAPRNNDWPQFRDLMISKRAEYMGGPFSVDHAWGDFCQGIALWTLFGFGSLSIDETNSGQCVGRVEINFGPAFPEPELGWMLFDPAFEGRGFALEAATAVRDWAIQTGKVQTLVSYIDPNNLRSLRLAEMLSAKLDESAEKQDLDDLVYRHL